LVGALVACPSSEPVPEATPEAATPPPGSVPNGASGQLIPPGHVPTLHYKPIGLAPQYAQYFGDADTLGRLAADLGALTPADSAALEVAWDDVAKAGSITLYVPEVDTRGEAVADAIEAGEPVPADLLRPLMGTIGSYRANLGGRYDLRILSFELRLSFWDKRTGTNCWIPGAIGDSEGTEIGPCFVCLDFRAEGGHVSGCRDGDAWPAQLTGDKPVLRRIGSAVRSNPL